MHQALFRHNCAQNRQSPCLMELTFYCKFDSGRSELFQALRNSP